MTERGLLEAVTEPRRVLVCGGRDYADAEHMALILNAASIDVLIHGAARGADSLADDWAKGKGVRVERYPADWDSHGRAAGHIRNAQMLTMGQPDLVIAFPGGKGTANMVAQAKAAGVKVVRITNVR